MDQKFLKRLISECPLTDFSQNGNVTERELQLDEYLEQFTTFLYSNENQLIQHFWQEYIASSEIGLLQNSEMLRRCFIFLDCAAAIYNYTARKSKGKKNSQIAEHVSVSTRTDLSQIKVFFHAAMHFIESEITDYLRESKLPAKDAVIMRNILVFLYQDFEKLDKNLKGDL